MLDLADFIEELREGEQVRWLGGEQDHRRGKYPFVSWGSVHGNGRLVSELSVNSSADRC